MSTMKKVIAKWESHQINNDHDVDQVFQTIYRYVCNLVSLAKVPPGGAYKNVNIQASSDFLNQIKESTKLARKAQKPTFRELHYTSNEFHSNSLPLDGFGDLSQNHVIARNQKYFKM